MKLHAPYVSASDFDGLYFQVIFDTESPDADFNLSVSQAAPAHRQPFGIPQEVRKAESRCSNSQNHRTQ
jgi:hypothetical protein